ncbi:MAG TPA: CocE/NonD family hydrolase [Pseudonocardiaceae bacterium]|jgi:hypothetical protein|nr:CocE/NonD family hydrolase [Pseudonocardiaceae bacterium]
MLHLRVDIPARDGTMLRGLRYAPSDEPAPTILVVTPYGADRYHPDGGYFASRGFNFVSIDCRGRGDSDGEFVPFVDDAADGNALVHRIAEHPWSNGDVVTYGGSYSGFNQWVTAATHPEPLRAIAPVAAVYPGRDFPIVHNVPDRHAVRWLTLVNGRRRNDGPYADEALWGKAIRELIEADRPYRDLDLFSVGQRLPVFQEWLNHPDIDDYWLSMVPTPDQAAAVTIPALTITGQYDDDHLGALTHLFAATNAANDVVIGPWDHAGTRTANTTFGGLTMAEAGKVDLKALHADWFDWVLGRGERPAFLADRVTYFHIGENRWRTSPTLAQGEESLDLRPDATLTIDPTKATARPTQFETETFAFPLADLQAHQESVLHLTDPIADPINITGRPIAHLTLRSDLPDFDLLISIYLIRDDTAIKLGEHPFRARYHASLTAPTPWPTIPTSVILPDFPFISLRTEPGDRIALHIAAPGLNRAPNFQRGGSAVDELPGQAVAGTVRIEQSADQPSYLRLPVTR